MHSTMTLNPPKILPWMARQAGIDDIQALSLWRHAETESEKMHGCRDGTAYHAEALKRFIASIPAYN
jgi:hypothetical protein